MFVTHQHAKGHQFKQQRTGSPVAGRVGRRDRAGGAADASAAAGPEACVAEPVAATARLAAPSRARMPPREQVRAAAVAGRVRGDKVGCSADRGL
jgi:hypothetical protein